ncbi:MAG: 5-formyltetrahydrofolate cyclo-ligase [Aestuariibaculum sp.]
MLKSELRKIYRQIRKDLTTKTLNDLSMDIANQLLKLPVWDKSFYHIFLSIEEQKEVNTDYILNILSGKDKHIVLSKSDFKTGLMAHFLLTDSTIIKKNSYHIPEPVDGISVSTERIEVVFIPLLAFDKQGNRIGYGKGFYDKFLTDCKPETVKIGLSLFEAETQISNVSKSDVKLDYCVTPQTIYRF